MIEKTDFGAYALYTLSSDRLQVAVTTLGAACVSICHRGRELALGFDSPEGYLNGDSYIGAVIGRYANRIGGAAAVIDGKRFRFDANEGKNLLHSGAEGFHFKRWEAEIIDDTALRLTLDSPDGEGGFPGRLRASVIYRVEGERLRLEFGGETDAPTLYAPTTHLYFRFGAGDVRRASLRLPAAHYLPTDAESLPTGSAPTEGDFDFSALRPIGKTYDHCFCLSGGAAEVRDETTRMILRTDFPGLHVYTGKYLPQPYTGLALEPEFYPDSPNHPEFPTTILRPGEVFFRYVEYEFSEVGTR